MTGDQSKQLPVTATQGGQLTGTVAQRRHLPIAVAKSRPAVGTLKKYGSFDSQEQKKTFPRIKSEPNIWSVQGNTCSTRGNKVKVQPLNRPVTGSSCTKEDIEKKRREPLARRHMSQQSQSW